MVQLNELRTEKFSLDSSLTIPIQNARIFEKFQNAGKSQSTGTSLKIARSVKVLQYTDSVRELQSPGYGFLTKCFKGALLSLNQNVAVLRT